MGRKTNAIDLYVNSGQYEGTDAIRILLLNFVQLFASYSNSILLIKEFQRLKNDENGRLKLEWSLQHTLCIYRTWRRAEYYNLDPIRSYDCISHRNRIHLHQLVEGVVAGRTSLRDFVCSRGLIDP